MTTSVGKPAVLSLENSVFVEQVNYLFINAYGVIFAAFVLSSLMAAGLWLVTSDPRVIVWILIYSLISVGRVWLVYRYKQNPPTTIDRSRNWANIWSFTQLLPGVMWGLASVLFLDVDNVFTIAILVIFTLGITTGAVSSTASYFPAYFLFLFPSVIPLAWMLISGGGNFIVIGIAICFYAMIGPYFAFQFHKTTIDSLRLRFENLNLIKEANAQRELAERERNEAENANISKSRFLAATSHDLRQPLHSLGLMVSILETTKDEDKRRSVYDQIRTSYAALEGLFNSLLDISKLDAGTQDVNLESISIADFFHELETEFTPLTRPGFTEITFKAADLATRSDPLLLKRVIRNIISNATRFTENGKILVTARKLDEQIVVAVYDQGIGIPEHEMENIFAEYVQLHNPERDRTKGLGLGLAIVRRICQLLDHRFTINSESGQGTVFRLWLPCAELPIDTPEANAEKPPRLELRKNVLVIDDEADIRESMKLILESWGCTVLTADSLSSAQQVLENFDQQIDGVVSDYRLRDNQTGITALDSIRQKHSEEIHGILITGDTSAEILREAKASGYPLLHKPVKPSQLRVALAARHKVRGSL
ncbi:MAG: hybrid sensor histidine kinase/response regulator [Pseudomonadota bacterium]